ncbi:ABC transporter permease [Yinghuangia seranimata]|uniref:ABC transporter permease n=1 Tax=Yinghuangia seranimata TaxID=408067 RepID=UPI00248AC020|nr:ABC transporter permease subunit [Yinghuangia seranimata]MDI2127564.1 ABC transporter permease subunit [Yinghuangia seranimata]
MPTLIANELLKLRTTRAPWLLAAGGPLLTLLGVTGLFASGADTGKADTATRAVAHAGMVSLLALVLGILAVAGEYRHKTITDTYLATPRRARVVAAKLVVYTGLGALLGVACAAVALPATAVGYAAKGASLDWGDTGVWRTLAGGVVWNAAFAAIGVGVGALVRNLAGAVSVALAWIALVEGLVGQLVGGFARWLPFAGGRAVGNLAPDAGDLLPQWGAAAVLVGYAAAFAAAAVSTTVRRDIT